MPAKNSYGLALLAVAGGALLSGAYAFASIYIPLIFFGVFIPLGVALFLIILLCAGLRGAATFRVLVCVIGLLVNIVALWFAVFWARWGLDEAIGVFSQGPEFVLDTIVRLSESMQFTFGDAKDVLRGSGITVSGVWLLGLWGLEAVAFAAAGVLGFRLGRERQHEIAGAGIRDEAGEAFRGGVPVVKGLALGTIKGLLQVALVFGAVYLLAEYVF